MTISLHEVSLKKLPEIIFSYRSPSLAFWLQTWDSFCCNFKPRFHSATAHAWIQRKDGNERQKAKETQELLNARWSWLFQLTQKENKISSLMHRFWLVMLQREWYLELYIGRATITSSSGEEEVFPELKTVVMQQCYRQEKELLLETAKGGIQLLTLPFPHGVTAELQMRNINKMQPAVHPQCGPLLLFATKGNPTDLCSSSANKQFSSNIPTWCFCSWIWCFLFGSMQNKLLGWLHDNVFFFLK